jgi:type I restriction enzyme S subunit
MELMPGYKQTTAAVIPDDWQLTWLGAHGETYGGLTGKTKRDFGTGDARYVTFMNVISNVVIDCDVFDRVHIAPAESQNRVRKNDLLFNGSSETPEEVAFCAVHLGDVSDLYLNSFCFGYRLRDQLTIDPLFLAYLFRSRAGRELVKALAQGSTRYNISKRALLGAPLALPPAAEQRAIAQALSDVDTLLATLDQMIAKKRDLKQAAMQQLLAGKTRLPGFSGEWTVKLVKDFGEIVTGGTPSTDNKEFWGEGYPWITPTDISTERDMITSERTITNEGLRAIRLLPANTVLVTCIASIGKNAILRSVGGCNQQINAIIPNDDNCAEFIYYVIEANKQYLLSNAGTTATAIVSKATFSELEFLVPAKPEQTAIACVLSDMDAELSALEARRDKTRNIKQAMMQELLTGKTRLV